MTTYLCVKCKMSWDVDNGDMDTKVSGGLCHTCLKSCLTALYRKRQLAEGNFDCFGKATTHCDQFRCKYLSLCLVKP